MWCNCMIQLWTPNYHILAVKITTNNCVLRHSELLENPENFIGISLEQVRRIKFLKEKSEKTSIREKVEQEIEGPMVSSRSKYKILS